jgi:hypothetical protein
VVEAATSVGVKLRATGGVGIALICPSARREPLQRTYQDIDMVASSSQTGELEALMAELGYAPEAEFNSLYSHQRMFFVDRVHERQVDVFVDAIEACHRLDLRDRLDAAGPSLAPADLLLSKLQVFQTNEKDYLDAIALLADHELTPDDSGVSCGRLAELCGNDWGWWRTATLVAERAHARACEISDQDGRLAHVPDRVRILVDELAKMPKTRRWRLRARIGDRVRWYDEPEEIEHTA